MTYKQVSLNAEKEYAELIKQGHIYLDPIGVEVTAPAAIRAVLKRIAYLEENAKPKIFSSATPIKVIDIKE